ncbi:MAG: SGNH/GDSL hydrolase family protein [Gammaproteobacteria bacterium]|nr:SGNH/GDSL hydrolase family protein [Gammaproteobacteria bacterium]NNL50718.1 SGNH/GDSL hydrolase family protein [Woeseiaceae bacterium]
MKILKRMAVALLVLLPLSTGIAIADTDHGYNRIFIFGASFMDSGNHFALTGETAHPPFELINFASYGVGGHRPTNGHTWVEVLAREMKLTKWAKPAYRNPAFGNYAVSYGRARDIDFDPLPSLYDQITDWKKNGYCTGNPMNDTLFIVDVGYRDLLDIALGEPGEQVVPAMMTSFFVNIGRLYACGARNLLMPNLPNLGAAPITPDGGEEAGRQQSIDFNDAVAVIIDHYSASMNVSFVDFFGAAETIMAMPEIFGFTNLDDPCITPYVTKGAFCKKRDEYLWWDSLHPTKKTHALLAQYALAYLPVPD